MKKSFIACLSFLLFLEFNSFAVEKKEIEDAIAKVIQFSATPQKIKEVAKKMES